MDERIPAAPYWIRFERIKIREDGTTRCTSTTTWEMYDGEDFRDALGNLPATSDIAITMMLGTQVDAGFIYEVGPLSWRLTMSIDAWRVTERWRTALARPTVEDDGLNHAF